MTYMEKANSEGSEIRMKKDLDDVISVLSGLHINDAVPGDNTVYLKPEIISEAKSKLESSGYTVTARNDGISYEIKKEDKIIAEIYLN